jgi:hypothetical protein
MIHVIQHQWFKYHSWTGTGLTEYLSPNQATRSFSCTEETRPIAGIQASK